MLAGHLEHVGQRKAGDHIQHRAADTGFVKHLAQHRPGHRVGHDVADLVLDREVALDEFKLLRAVAAFGREPVARLGVLLRQDVVGVGLFDAVEGDGVLDIACAGGDRVFAALQRQLLKDGHVVNSYFGPDGLAVEQQRDFRLVGVDIDAALAGGAVRKAAAADMHHRRGGPVGLVNVEGVLLDLAVVGHKALVVAALAAALVAGVGRKVEHVPHMGAPDIGAGREGLEHFVVVVCLVFLGVVVVFRLGGMPGQDGFGAVLRDADRAGGVLFVELIQPGAVFLHLAHVPAEVVVIAEHIGDVDMFGIHRDHADLGHRGQAAGVQALAQGVELAEVLVERFGLAADRDLVGNAPEADGGVVVVLGDQLGHLADCVVVRGLAGVELADERDLGPDDHARLVGQLIEIRVVLVVGQADRVGANLLDQGHVLLMLLAGDGPAHVKAVLVAGDAVQRVGLAV